MTEQMGIEAEESGTVEGLQNTLVEYLEKMDTAKLGRGTLFKTSHSKTDLETKVWHCYHKVEASAYHMQQIKKRVAGVRANLKNITGSSLTELPLAVTEFRMTVRDRAILFDIDAFFTASRSAIDFLGSCLSRYIRGKETDRFREIVKFLAGTEDDLAKLVVQAWDEWAEDLGDYRDYLVHQGALPTATASHVVIEQPQGTDDVSHLIDELSNQFGGHSSGEPIVYPLPLKPNRALRITRQDIFSITDDSEMTTGLTETTFTVETGSPPNKGGPKIRVAVNRSLGSRSFDMSIEGPLSTPNSMTKKFYELAPGYIEAEDLCKKYHDKLLHLVIDVFESLREKEFTHLA